MPRGRPATRASLPVEEIAAAAATPPEVHGDLGPAVTDEFRDALGLHELRAAGGGGAGRRADPAGSAAPATPAAPAPSVDYSKLILKMLVLVDAATSAAIGVARESQEELETPAECITPWVVAHAGDVTNETGMRLLALSGLVTFVAMKILKWAAKPKPKPKRPDVATAPTDFEEVQA